MAGTTKLVRRAFDLWYRSRISVAAASGLMTAVSSRILAGALDRRILLVVVVGTAAAYWVDDCLDFGRDHRGVVSGLNRLLHGFKYVAALGALGAVGLILPHLRWASIALLLVLGVFTLGFCVASFRLEEAIRASRRWIALRALAISLVWSLATVLLPVLNRAAPVTLQVVSAIGFVWMLMLTVSAMWTEGEHPERERGTWRAYERVLAISCYLAGILVVVGIAIGWFPWMNLALLPACAANLLFLYFRLRFQQTNRRVLTELLVWMNILDCLFVLGAYAHPESGSWPRTWQAWWELAAFVLFFGNIALKSLKLKHPDDHGDGLDLIFLLGLGIFGFQLLVSVFHVESWLFASLHKQLFSFRIASLAGATMIAIAVALQSAAYLRMADAWRLMAKSDRPTRLIMSGPFAVSRNPIYVSAELLMLGTFFMNGTPVFAFFVLFAPIVIQRQIIREEQLLSRTCPVEYADYTRHTPRYLFF